ncbi:MAG TPA: SDR family NAD(P)-dependent oxidoreductase, partial [Phenylobacterium sp.]|nr:SDR family NAD(P)-dependent oxidoreductase [Phenylobacterium sp.]
MTVHPALTPGKIAVITGGASGIGLAAAKRFATLGLKVCIADANPDALDKAAAELGGAGLAVRVDVSDRASVEALADRVEAELGPVAVLMNNAGVGGGGDALSNPDGWLRVLG